MQTRRNLILGAVLAALIAAPTVADTMSSRNFAWDKAEVTAAAAQIEAWVFSVTPLKAACDRLAHRMKK
ncbi:MAG TPA: hypothetical protein VFV07_11695 [Rhizomicrobium sp.]|nr:hypothetical protein [Rhizomicrobium sp.]